VNDKQAQEKTKQKIDRNLDSVMNSFHSIFYF
jgi:hypothetical protein